MQPVKKPWEEVRVSLWSQTVRAAVTTILNYDAAERRLNEVARVEKEASDAADRLKKEAAADQEAERKAADLAKYEEDKRQRVFMDEAVKVKHLRDLALRDQQKAEEQQAEAEKVVRRMATRAAQDPQHAVKAAAAEAARAAKEAVRVQKAGEKAKAEAERQYRDLEHFRQVFEAGAKLPAKWREKAVRDALRTAYHEARKTLNLAPLSQEPDTYEWSCALMDGLIEASPKAGLWTKYESGVYGKPSPDAIEKVRKLVPIDHSIWYIGHEGVPVWAILNGKVTEESVNDLWLPLLTYRENEGEDGEHSIARVCELDGPIYLPAEGSNTLYKLRAAAIATDQKPLADQEEQRDGGESVIPGPSAARAKYWARMQSVSGAATSERVGPSGPGIEETMAEDQQRANKQIAAWGYSANRKIASNTLTPENNATLMEASRRYNAGVLSKLSPSEFRQAILVTKEHEEAKAPPGNGLYATDVLMMAVMTLIRSNHRGVSYAWTDADGPGSGHFPHEVYIAFQKIGDRILAFGRRFGLEPAFRDWLEDVRNDYEHRYGERTIDPNLLWEDGISPLVIR